MRIKLNWYQKLIIRIKVDLWICLKQIRKGFAYENKV